MTAADAILIWHRPISSRPPKAIAEAAGPRPLAIAESVRPSPFEHRLVPVIEVTQTLPARVEHPAPELVAAREAAAEPPAESRLDRIISRIPLLRRFRKRPQPEGNEPR